MPKKNEAPASFETALGELGVQILLADSEDSPTTPFTPDAE